MPRNSWLRKQGLNLYRLSQSQLHCHCAIPHCNAWHKSRIRSVKWSDCMVCNYNLSTIILYYALFSFVKVALLNISRFPSLTFWTVTLIVQVFSSLVFGLFPILLSFSWNYNYDNFFRLVFYIWTLHQKSRVRLRLSLFRQL